MSCSGQSTRPRWAATGRARTTWSGFQQPGRIELAARATDPDGATGEPRVTIEVGNAAPRVAIHKPSPDQPLYAGTAVSLYGTAPDPNEPGRTLDCDRLEWTSDVAGDPLPVRGCRPEVTFPTPGTRTLTLRGTDAHGATAADQLRIDVLARPDDPPPSARIVLPFDGQVLRDPEQPVELRTSAIDPLGQGLDYRWSVTFPSDPGTGTGGETVGVEPSAGRWRPADSFDLCELAGQPVRLSLTVVAADGRTGSDFVVLETVHCLDG